MHLADPAEIRDQLGFDDMTDINEAIDATLNAATAVLAARLGTEFDAGSFVDTFYADDPAFEQGRSVQTSFRLSRGFVDAVSGFGATDAIDAFGGTSEISLLPVAVVDKEGGVVRDFSTRYRAQFIRVTYTAGFPVAGANPKSYDLTKVPDWLQQAAKLRAMILLSGSPPLEQAGIKVDTKTLGMELGAILARKVRYAPVALLPL